MNRLLLSVALAALAATAPTLAADVGVSVNIGEPGFYGRLDIGGYPQPQVIYHRPIVVERAPTDRAPIYLRVPPGHAKNWRKHCREYNACDERVFFVRDNWYTREYVPRYREHHRHRGADRGDERRDEHRGDQREGRNERHGDDHDRGRNR